MGETKTSNESFDKTVQESFSSEDDSLEVAEEGGVEVGISSIPPAWEKQRDSERAASKKRTVRVIGLVIVAVAILAAVIGVAVAATSDGGTRQNGTSDTTAASGYNDSFPGYAPDPDDFPQTTSEKAGATQYDEYGTKDTSRPAATATGGAQTIAPVRQEAAAPPSYLGPPPSTDDCNVPPAWADDEMGWDDLTADQRSAAVFLGYTEFVWNEEDQDDTTDSQEGQRQQASFDARYAELEWTDLTPAQRTAFAYVGYDAGSYSDFYNDYYFDELPSQVQAAADAVGYTRAVWNNCTAEICSAQVDSSMWQSLSGTERANLEVLGYNCWIWNNYDFGGGIGRV